MIDIEQLKTEFAEALAGVTTSQELFQLQKKLPKGPSKRLWVFKGTLRPGIRSATTQRLQARFGTQLLHQRRWRQDWKRNLR